jgi:cell division protein ZapE
MSALLDDLTGAVLAPATPAELVPPPRFAGKDFAGFRIDPAVPGQAEAVDAVRAFARQRPSLLQRLGLRDRGRPGLYLDGGFGVGKTHLLAASFHAAHGVRRYLSFAEAISLVVLHGARPAAALIAGDLVCLDEFELDDPANTRLADLLLEQLVGHGARIVTTSNTVPGELGEGRMAVDQFRNQLARIADRFASVNVPGGDFRRHAAHAGDPAGWGAAAALRGDATALDATALDALLSRVPVANLGRLAARLPLLDLVDLAPFSNQLAALRFVNLVDKLYDWCSSLRVRASCPIAGLFPEEHCQRAFAKKYRRCQSRLVELCA